jgi:hypothetical protein
MALAMMRQRLLAADAVGLGTKLECCTPCSERTMRKISSRPIDLLGVFMASRALAGP